MDLASLPAAASSSRTSSKGAPYGNRAVRVEPFRVYRGIIMRRWSRFLVAIAILAVVTQMVMIGIAMVHLEDSLNGSTSTVELFGAFRHDSILSREDFAPNLHHEQTHKSRAHLPISPVHQHPAQKDHRFARQDEEELPPPSKFPQQERRERERELIHIIHTRFMQHQGNLTTLGVARLKQFTSFCLPTMVNQTTQDFLWIIKVDPILEENDESRRLVLEPLLRTIHANENNNIYVVGSNYNFNMEGHKGSWRDGQEGEELLPLNNKNNNSSVPAVSKVYTGDMARLKRAYEMRDSLPVLETRLDADDGLNHKYLERVQTIALDRFLGPARTQSNKDVDARPIPKPQWLYWCILTQIEWHSELYSNNSTNSSAPGATALDTWELRNNEKKYYGNPSLGYVVPIANDNFCITPGLTVGYGVGVTVESVPRYPHTSLFPSLHNKFKFCYSAEDKPSTHKGPCLERMGGVHKSLKGKSSYLIHAIRSRTLTSAGMDGVGNSDSVNQGRNDTKTTSSPINQSDAASGALIGAKETARKEKESDRLETLLWKLLESSFGIDPSDVKRTQKFLMDNRLEIALENGLGQCSMGHSCKDKALERLQKIVQGHRLSQNASL